MIINWFQAVLVAIVVALVCFGLHSLDVWRLDAQYQSKLNSQAASIRAECDKNDNITKEVDYATQSQISNLDKQYLSSEQLRPNAACPMSAAGTPSSNNGTAGGQELIHTNEVTRNELLSIAHDGEKYRLQLKGCQDFIKKTWDAMPKQ